MSELGDYFWIDEMGDFDPMLPDPNPPAPVGPFRSARVVGPGEIIGLIPGSADLTPEPVKHPNAKPLTTWPNYEVVLEFRAENERVIDELVAQALTQELAREEKVARLSLEVGFGYARIDGGYWTDYVLSTHIPAGERYDFPNAEAFYAWMVRQRG